MSEKGNDYDAELTAAVKKFQLDPLGFVMMAFPWGEPGELSKQKGPRKWQRETLSLIGERLRAGATVQEAIQIATASGHGIGKSALVAMVILWAMSTVTDTRGVVTANTEKQLTTKTWPELAKWHRMCIVRAWFVFTATALYSSLPGHDKTWRIDAIAWSLNNTEAFAGLHNKDARILIVFDEASGIPQAIWEVTEGALTDENTEIIWLAFGNPTQNTGRFFECFNKLKHRWLQRQIDSRTVEGTNAAQIAKWVEDFGEDSDFVKVRVRGVFPSTSALQFIPRSVVDGAMKREPATTSWSGRLACVGVDVARFGDDQSSIATRVGRDARSIPPKKFRGLSTMQLASRVVEHTKELTGLGLRFVLFVDGGGVGGGVVDRLRQLDFDVIEVQFGGAADDPKKYANKRAEIWGKLRDWLPYGSIPDDEDFACELTSVEYGFTPIDQILLESKKAMKARGLASPDVADGLAVTFAQDVAEWDDTRPPSHGRGYGKEYDPTDIHEVCAAPRPLNSIRRPCCSLLPSKKSCRSSTCGQRALSWRRSPSSGRRSRFGRTTRGQLTTTPRRSSCGGRPLARTHSMRSLRSPTPPWRSCLTAAGFASCWSRS